MKSSISLTVLSLRYSSWSMRPWLVLTQAGATFKTNVIELTHIGRQVNQSDDAKHSTAKIAPSSLSQRRALGSVHGLFPTLHVDGTAIHESLAICEYVAEQFPDAHLWPENALVRAQARAISCEMVSGFTHMRSQMSCHLFGRVNHFAPNAAAQTDINRIFEIWQTCLSENGGPFLFGRFSIADAMYFPVLTRFRTYGIELPTHLLAYANALETLPAVVQLRALAITHPRMPAYDDYLISVGGDPEGALK